MRFGCVVIYRLSVQVERIGRHSDKPLIIGGFPFERKPVYDASIEAIQCGVKLGMPLSQAYVLCPEAEFLPVNERRYHEVYEQVAHVVESFSPSVETRELGYAFFNATGFEDELKLASEIVGSLFCLTGLRACLGIASNKFLAKVAAYTTKPEVPIIVPQGNETSFLAPFSVKFLPSSDETKRRLNLLGIRIIGQLLSFSKEALIEQFGEDGVMIYELAHGIDRTSLYPRTKPRLIMDKIQFNAPVTSSLELVSVIDRMLDRFLAEFREKGQVLRKIKLTVNLPKTSEEVVFRLKEATNSRKAVMVRLRSWLERTRFSEAIDGIDICLEAEEDRGKQLSLLKERSNQNNRLVSLSRLGLKRATIVDEDSLIPERSFRLTDV